MVKRKIRKDEWISKYGLFVDENAADENIIVHIIFVFTMNGEVVIIIVFGDGHTTIFICRCLEWAIQIIFID